MTVLVWFVLLGPLVAALLLAVDDTDDRDDLRALRRQARSRDALDRLTRHGR